MDTSSTWLTRVLGGIRSFGNTKALMRPKIGVALGGGFARGLAHIGVLRVLETHGIPIDYLAGTSVGALIAAAYAGGSTLDEMERRGAQTHFRDFGSWTISRMGMASNQRLEEFLHRFTEARTFEEMKIPLSIVATDLVTGKSVHFTEGEIGVPLRASCAYPGMFTPIDYKDHSLADGFLSEAAPAQAVREMGADIVISVYLDPGLLDEKPRNTIEVISRSFSILQTYVDQPWRRETDVLIEPDVQHILWYEFDKCPALVESGKASALRAMPKIRAVLEAWPNRLERRRTDVHRVVR